MDAPHAAVLDLIGQYDAALTAAAEFRHELAMREVMRARWVNEQITALVTKGVAITRAKDDVHAMPEHQDWQQGKADISLRADLADRDGRVLAYRVRLALLDLDLACEERHHASTD